MREYFNWVLILCLHYLETYIYGLKTFYIDIMCGLRSIIGFASKKILQLFVSCFKYNKIDY